MVVRGWVRWVMCAALVAGSASIATSAFAFCRSRACDFDKAKTVPCNNDASECPTNGAVLYWPTPTFDMWVDHHGSPRRSLTGEQLRDTLAEAFATWQGVSCKDGAPSIAVANLEVTQDDALITLGLTKPLSASSDDPAVTTSIATFIDEGWVTQLGQAIALTTTSYGTKSGRIFGADIELNSQDINFTLDDDPNPNYDLLAVLTHESGHVLGLADLRSVGPTMYGTYQGHGDVGPRSLEDDDKQGVCTIYPNNRFDKDGGCGCRLAAPPSQGFGWLSAVFTALVVARRQARQRGVSTKPSAPPT